MYAQKTAPPRSFVRDAPYTPPFQNLISEEKPASGAAARRARALRSHPPDMYIYIDPGGETPQPGQILQLHEGPFLTQPGLTYVSMLWGSLPSALLKPLVYGTRLRG